MARAERDRTGRVTGMGVFVLGVVLLLVVFYLAYLELVAPGALAGTLPGRSTGDTALLIATKGLFLFLLGFVASAMANKGIALYQAAGSIQDEE